MSMIGRGSELDELADLVAGRAPVEGLNGSSWSGLAFCRFDGPTRAHDEVAPSLSIHVILQGRARVQLDDGRGVCGPGGFFVVAQGTRFVVDVLDASGDRPLLALLLRIDPVIAIELHSEVEQRSERSPPPTEPDAPPGGEVAYVSPLGDELGGALSRFVRATDTDVDRRVLAPLALREVIYRVLRSARGAALAEGAHLENAGDRIAGAIAFMRGELHRPIKVEDMAAHVGMSASTFAHLFKARTGSAPYQYLKRLRLDRALALLVEGNRSVGEASRAVGYGSVSHFIVEFKRAYGETPRSYAARLRRSGTPHAPAPADISIGK